MNTRKSKRSSVPARSGESPSGFLATILSLLVVQLCSGICQAALICDQPELDFGQAYDFSVIEHTFILRNTGDAPVTIRRVQSNCSCTASRISSNQILPGATTEITVKASLADRIGPQLFKINVVTDYSPQPLVPLIIRGNVTRQIDIVPQPLILSAFPQDTGTVSGEITVSNRDLIAFSISGIGISDPVLQVSQSTSAKETQHRIRVQIDTSLVEPPYNGTVYLQTDHPRYPLLQIPVQFLLDRAPVVPVESEGAVTIQVFYQPGCPECETVRREIEPMLVDAFPGQFHLEWLDVTEPAHLGYLLRTQEMLNVQDSDPVSVLVNGQVLLSGLNRIRSQIIPTIQRILENHRHEDHQTILPLELQADPFAAARRRVSQFTLVGVMIAGLIDSLNPCAISVLVFFVTALSMTGVRGYWMLAAGGTFIAGSFVTYFVLGFGLLSGLYRLNAFETVRGIFDATLQIILIALFVFSMIDAWRYHRSKTPDALQLQLPGRLKTFIRRFTNRQLKKRSVIPAALIIGSGVTLLEGACTGQVYIPALALIARSGQDLPRVYGLLILYNLMFVTPLIIVFSLMSQGMQAASLMAWSRRHVVLSKIMMALLFLAMAVSIKRFAP